MKRICVLSVVLLFLTSVVYAGTVNLPKTGQTKCYDSSGTEISCAGTGQDGEIQAGVAWPEPRFRDNGNGTMTDNLTGLMWTKNANLAGSMTWEGALDYCNNSTLGGYSDWRLPNVNELESLVNGAESNTATWLNTQGFNNVQATEYWSSTSWAYGLDYAWVVDMLRGYVSAGGGKSYYYSYVWPVRGGQCGSFDDSVICLPRTGQKVSYAAGDDGDLEKGIAWPSPRFNDHGNGTVTDNLTALMWTKDVMLSGGSKHWQQALDYVNGMNKGTYNNFGYTDWRLPNRKELYSLIDFSRYEPALPSGNPFTSVQVGNYWSSTSIAYYPGYAWVDAMWYGDVGYGDKSYDAYYVWPVRGGQVGSISYSISGTVTGDVQSGVTITLSGNDSGTTTTDSSGNYSFDELTNGTYTITPSKSGYTFTPPSRSVTINGANQTNQNFTASAQRIPSVTSFSGTKWPPAGFTCSNTSYNN